MKLKSFFLLSVFLLFALACNEDNTVESEVAKIDISLDVERFDKILGAAKADNLEDIKRDYPFLFPKEIDSMWTSRLFGDLQQEIFDEVTLNYDNVEKQELELEDLFRHLKYYDSTFETPRVITIADYVDYRNKLILEENLLIINLSNYLGSEHRFYQNIPQYFSKNMITDQIVPEIAGKYAMRYAYQNQRRTFLDEIVYQGKLLYFKEMMLPNTSESQIMGYSDNDIKWAQVNEVMIWSYFVENEILFKTDPKLFQRFTVPGPFSKFGLEIDNESPPRLGSYIGWQIVKAFKENSDMALMDLMRTDADEIFKTSKYKPRR